MIRLISLLLLLSTLGHALSLSPRDAAQIQSDLTAVDRDTNSLNSAIAGFNGASPVPAQDYYQQLDKDLKTCATDAKNSGVITPPQAKALCNFVTTTLYNDTRKLLNTFVGRKTSLAAAGLQSTALGNLKQLRADTASCLLNIGAGGPSPAISPAKSSCSAAAQGFDSLYASAIAAYSN